jgi:hypothetical protein
VDSTVDTPPKNRFIDSDNISFASDTVHTRKCPYYQSYLVHVHQKYKIYLNLRTWCLQWKSLVMKISFSGECAQHVFSNATVPIWSLITCRLIYDSEQLYSYIIITALRWSGRAVISPLRNAAHMVMNEVHAIAVKWIIITRWWRTACAACLPVPFAPLSAE